MEKDDDKGAMNCSPLTGDAAAAAAAAAAADDDDDDSNNTSTTRDDSICSGISRPFFNLNHTPPTPHRPQLGCRLREPSNYNHFQY